MLKYCFLISDKYNRKCQIKYHNFSNRIFSYSNVMMVLLDPMVGEMSPPWPPSHVRPPLHDLRRSDVLLNDHPRERFLERLILHLRLVKIKIWLWWICLNNECLHLTKTNLHLSSSFRSCRLTVKIYQSSPLLLDRPLTSANLLLVVHGHNELINDLHGPHELLHDHLLELGRIGEPLRHKCEASDKIGRRGLPVTRCTRRGSSSAEILKISPRRRWRKIQGITPLLLRWFSGKSKALLLSSSGDFPEVNSSNYKCESVTSGGRKWMPEVNSADYKCESLNSGIGGRNWEKRSA